MNKDFVDIQNPFYTFIYSNIEPDTFNGHTVTDNSVAHPLCTFSLLVFNFVVLKSKDSSWTESFNSGKVNISDEGV